MADFDRNLLSSSILQICAGSKPLFPAPALLLMAAPALAADVAHDIQADGSFTDISSANAVHTVTSKKTSGAHAINVFDKFVVGTSHTVNLQVPNDLATGGKLVNIVRGTDAPTVHGVLNSYKNGQLGGDVVFASSAGFVVGSTGVVNVGSLSVKTPSASDLDNLISGGEADSSKINDLLNNNFSISSSGTVRIQGKINAASGVDINANTIEIGSSSKIISGTTYGATGVVSAAAVNVDDLTIPTQLQVSGGTIVLKAASISDNAINISGDLYADGGFTITANDITLNSGSTLDARNATDATRGDVTITASASEAVGIGQASTKTAIDFGGTVYADDLTAKAKSVATSSMYEEPGTVIGQMAGGVFAGASFYLMDAEADATVNVNSGANIQASGNVALTSESHAITDASAITLGNALPGAVAAIYATSDATSTTHVKTGATVEAGGSLEISAHNESYVSATAFEVVASDSNVVSIAAAVGESDVNATAKIDSGVTLDADSLVLTAENQNYYQVSATAYGLKNTRYGIAVAVGDFDTNATAELGSSLGTDLDKTGNVTIAALDRTLNQRVHSSITVGDNAFMRTLGSKPVAGLSAMQNGVNSFTSKFLPTGQSAPQDSSGKVDFKGGLAFTLNLSDHDAYSFLGTNVSGQAAPAIKSNGNVLVLSQTDLGSDNTKIAGGNSNGAAGGDQGGYRTSAEASVSSPAEDNAGTGSTPQSEKSLALALNFAINDSDAVAEVGKRVQVDAANLGVVAIQQMPLVSTYDQWDSFSSVTSKFTGVAGLQNNLLTSFANAGASADAESYGGSLNVVVNDMDTKAWINDGVSVTTTGTGTWSVSHVLKANSQIPGLFGNSQAFKDITYQLDFTDSVTVKAYNLMETANVAGNIGTLGIIPNGNGTNEKGKSIGGSITFVQQSGTAVAGIGKAIINSAGNVGIYAETDERHFLVTPSSGQGSGMGFNGVLGFLNSEVISHASLHNQAQLSADQLVIAAEHDFGNWAAAGAVNWSDESAVGVAIAANVSQGDTKAWIGDNSSDKSLVKFQDSSNNNTDKPTPSAPTEPVPIKGVIVNTVSVRGRASGTNGSLAVAGALTTEPTNEPGAGTKVENWYSGLSSKLSGNYSSANSSSGSSSVGGASSSGANGSSGSGGSGQSSANVSAAQTGMAAAGSFTVSVNNIDAKAMIKDAYIRGHDIANSSDRTDVDVNVQALEKVISASVTGSAALSLMGGMSPTNQTTIAGAISYQISFNDSLAWLTGSVIENAGDISVQALHGGELTSVALALSVTRPDPTSVSTQSGALSISGAQIYDGTSARIKGSTISSNQGTSDDLEVSAYNNSDIGVGGGTLYAGGKQGAGLAITFAEINDPSALVGSSNPDDGNHFSPVDGEDVYDGAATEAIIDYSGSTRTTLSNFDRVDVTARSLNRIGIGAAGIGYNDNLEDSLGFQGSFAIGSIGADTKALVKGATITSAVVNVDATGEKGGALDKVLSDLGSSDINKEFDFSGGEAIDNTNVHVSDDGSSSSYSYASEGKRIIAVAGAVQIGKKNLGISYSHADVKSDTSARIEDTNINQSSGTGVVNVHARDNALLYSVAIGVGVGTGGFSGVGSVAVNRLNNRVTAEIGDWNGTDKGTINVSSLSVSAQNDMDMINVAGSIAVAGGQGAASAGGLAVALNLVGTNEHSTRARISNTSLQVDGDLTVKAQSGDASNHNLLVGNAIAIGASTGQSGLAFAGAITVNNVDQSIEAGIKDVGTNRSSSASSNDGGNVLVKGQDYTDSVATAWMGAGSGQGSALGIATATNRVDSDVTAEILGDGSASGSTTLKAQNVFVDAHRRNWLLTIDAGVAASKQIAFAPSIGTGVIDGNVKARIADDATVEAWNNVVVEASARSVNLVGSGSLGIGIDGGAGALAISTAVEYGKTESFVDNAEITAKGLGTDYTTGSGQLKNQVSQPDLSSAGEGSSSSVNIGSMTSGFGSHSQEEKTESASGLIVTATSFQKQRAITVGGAGSKNIAITANVATTSVDSETSAYIKDAEINNGLTPDSNADVLVRAGNHSFGLAVSAGGSVTVGGESGAAAIGGFSTNLDSKDTLAKIENSNVKANEVEIDAQATKVAQAVSAGVAAALGSTSGLGGAASVVITKQNGNTKARLFGGTVTADSLLVNAETRQEANVAAGAAGLGTTVGVGIGLAVNLVGGDTHARIGKDSSDSNNNITTTVNVADVDVEAQRLAAIRSYAFGAGIGASGTGVAAMVNTSEVTGETRSGIYGHYSNGSYTTQVRGKDGSSKATDVDIQSQEILDASQITAGLGVGATVGVGAVANVLLGRSQTYGEIIGADIKATSLDVRADTLREASLISVSGAGGQYSAAISIGLVLMGQGDSTTDDGVNAENEFGASRSMANNALAVNYSDDNPHLNSDDQNNLNDSGSVAASSSAASADSVYVSSGSRLTLSGESVTAARISGGKIVADTLTVNSDARLHTYQGVGAAQGSAVGVAGGIGVTRLYDMSIATVDADITADTVNVKGLVRDKDGNDAAGEMKNFIISAGGTAIGVSYSDVRSKHRVVAGLTQAVSSDTANDSGTLSVTAKDTTELRIGDTDSDVSANPEQGTLNITVGAGAIGVSVGIAEKDSDVDAWLGAYDDKGTTSTTDDVHTIVDGFSTQTVTADVSGRVRSTAFAGAGGLLVGVQGVATDARDKSDVDAVVYGQIGSGSNGSLTVRATAVPETFSRAYGVTVAGGASVGGSFAYAKADTTANAKIADRTLLSENGTVTVDAVTGKSGSSYVSADATAFAASGGLLVGISGAEAKATNNSDTTARIGDYVQLPVGDLNVSASNRSRQISDADGYFVGLYSAGLTFSTAESQTSTRVLFGKDPVGPASRNGDIILLANSVDENQGFSTAGGGGYVSGSATVSNSHTKDSNSKESASVEVADWSSAYTSNQVGAGRVQMEANHQTLFFAGANSINVSVFGGSGARSDVEVDLDTSVDLGKNVSFYADEIDFSASNSVDQIGDAWFNSFEHSVKAGAGGGINGSAALSDINVSHLGASVDVGKNVVLKIDPLADINDAAHAMQDYHIQMDAFTHYNISDRVVLEVGGALQGAGAESSVRVNAVNTVNLGQNVQLLNPVGQVELGTYSRGFATADASAAIWAAAGVAGGVTDVDLTTTNNVTIGDGVDIESFESTKILAGRSADYITENYLSADARTNVYNWTLIPIPATKTADADVTVNNNIYFGNNVNVSSVRDILLEADRGYTSANGDGVERNPYLEMFSSETSFGSSNADRGSSNIVFNGTTSLEAGSRYQQAVTIDSAGRITKGSGTEAVAYNYGTFSSRASLQTYIDELNAEKTTLLSQTGGVDNSQGGINDGGDSGQSNNGSSSSSNVALDAPARVTQIDEELAFLVPLLDALPSSSNDAIYVGGLFAAGGDVNLKADTVSVLSGSPTITAHGDPTITVTNNSSRSLILGDMYIPDVGGGTVSVSGSVAGNLPAGLTVVEGNAGSGSHINIQHKPTVTTGADVVLQGDLSNYGGVVTVNVEKGNLIQTGSVTAKQMSLSVPSGVYLLNNQWGTQSYGFSPESLAGFTSQWKPATADQLVMYYVNAAYSSEMSSKGEESFNQWWYGNDYYGNNEQRDGNLRVYLNWGFNDGAECKSGGDCEIFQFDGNSSSRGSGNWGFNQIKDYQNNLVKTASYQQVKNAGYGDQGGYALEAQLVAVNAYRIDINGTIRAGNFNEWSVQVGDNFDSAMAQYVAAKGLSTGSVIKLSPGQKLSWQALNPNYDGILNRNRYVTYTVDPQVSLVNGGDAGIGISYEVGSGRITLDDVNASGNGFVSLRGRIMSTGADGKILVDDGRGAIDVVNRSATELVINDLNAGSQSTGVIRMTDLNYKKNGSYFSEWYVHEPGQQIKKYETSASATTYTGVSASNVGYSEGGKQTYTYQPKKGQLYYFVQQEEVERSLTWKMKGEYIDGYFSTYQPLGDWYYDNPNNPNNGAWDVAYSGFTSCSYISSVACNSDGSVGSYLTHVMDDRYKSQTWLYPYTTSYSKYYGGDFTKIKWNIYVPTYIAMKSTSYVKADHPIKFQFIGADTGSIDVQSRTGVTLTGNINNSSGTTTVNINRGLGSAGRVTDSGSILMAESGILSSEKAYLNAVGSIGSANQAVNLITDHISAVANGGLVNIDLTAASGDIAVEKLHAASSLTVNVDKGLTPYGSGTHLKGGVIDITSEFGGIGDVAGNKVMNLSSTGLVTINATGDIALRQSSGDLTLNSLNSDAGDIWITLDNGHLVNGIGQQRHTDDELAYQASVWDRLNLQSDDAGQGAVTAYENQVTGQYHGYWLIKQRLDDDSSDSFAINSDYLDAFKLRYKSRQDALNGTDLDLDGITVEQVTAAVKDEYLTISQWLGDEQADGRLESSYSLGSSYDSSYRFEIADNSALHNKLTDGARWSDSQLEITISSAALEPVTDGYISSREANISGNNIRLDINKGRLGEDLADLAFTINRTNPSLTDSQKVALLEAGPGDLSIKENASNLEVRVKQQDPVKINANGLVSISAGQQIYIESDSALALKKVTSPNDVRIATGGSITTQAGSTPTIAANNLNLSTSSGSIGTVAAPIRLDIDNALRSVAAPGDVWLQHAGGGLQLGAIGAGGHLNLDVSGVISNWLLNGDNIHIVANSATLKAGDTGNRFDLGANGRGLKLKLTGGELKLEGDSAWLQVDSTTLVDIADVQLDGHLDFDSSSRVDLTGNITLASLDMDVEGDIAAQNALTVAGSGGINILANTLDLQKASVSGAEVYLEADSGPALFSNVTGTLGRVTLLSSGDMNLYGTVQAAQPLVIDSQTLTMHSGSDLDANDSATLTTVGDMSLRDISGESTLKIVGDNLTLNGDVVVTDTISLTGIGDIFFNSEISSEQGSVIVNGQKSLFVNRRLSANKGVELTLGDTFSLSNNQMVDATGLVKVQAKAVDMASDSILKTTGAATITVDSMAMADGATLDVGGDLTLTTSDKAELFTLDIGGHSGLNTGSDLTINDTLTVGESLTLTVTGDTTLNGQVDITDNLIADLEGTLVAESRVTVGNNIEIDVEQDAVFNGELTTVAGLLKITGNGDLAFNNNVVINDTVTLDIAETTTLAGNKVLQSGGAFTANSRSVIFGDGSLLAVNGAMKLTTDEQTELFTLYVTDRAEVMTGADLLVNDTVTVGESLALTVASDTTLNGQVDITDSLIADLEGALVAEKRVTAGNSINIEVEQDATFNGALTTNTGQLNITGNSNLAFNDDVSINDTVTLQIADAITLSESKTLQSGGDLTANSRSVGFVEGSLLSVGGALNLIADEPAELYTLAVTGNAKLTTGTDLIVNDTVTVGNSLELTAGGNTALNGTVNITNNLIADLEGALIAENHVTVGNNIEIDVEQDAVFNGELTTVAGLLKIMGNGDLDFNNNVVINDTVTLDIAENTTLAGNKILQSGGAFTANSRSVIFGDGSLLAVNGAMKLTTDEQTTLFTLYVTDNAEVTAGADLLVNDTITVGDTLTLTVTGDTTLNGQVAITDNLIADLEGALVAENTVTVGNDIEIDVEQDAVFNGELTTVAGLLKITGNGDLAFNNNVVINDTVILDIAETTTLAENKIFQSGGAFIANSRSVIFGDGSLLSVNGAMKLTTDEQTTLFTLYVTDSAEVTAGADLLVNDTITVGDTLTLTVAGDTTLKGATDIANNWLADLDGSLLVESNIAVGNDVEVTVEEDATFNGELTTDTGLLRIVGNGNLAFNRDVAINDTITLEIAEAITLAEDKTLQSGNDLTANSRSFVAADGSLLNVGGSMNLTTVDQTELFTIDVSDSADLSVGGGLAINDSSTVGDNLTLSVVGDTTLSGPVEVANNWLAELDGNLLAESTIVVGNDIDVVVEQDARFDGELSTDAGLLKITGKGNLIFNGNVGINDTVTLDIAEAITLAEDRTLQSGGDFIAKSGAVAFANGSLLSVGEALNLTTVDKAELFTLDGTGNAKLTVGSDLIVNDTITVSDSLNLTVAGDTTLHGQVDVTKNLKADLKGGLLVRNNATVGNTIEIAVEDDAIFDGTLTTTTGLLNITGKGSLFFNRDVTIEDRIDLDLAESLVINERVTVASGSDTSVKADQLMMATGSTLNIDGGLNAQTTDNQDWATLVVNGNMVSVSDQGDIQLGENADVSGDMTLAANGAIELASGVTVTINSLSVGSESSTGADSFAMGSAAKINAAGGVLIHTENDQRIGQLTSLSDNRAFFLKSSAGALRGRDDLDLDAGERHLTGSERVGCSTDSTACTGAESYLQAATGIGDPLVVDLPWLSAETDTGDIHIVASTDLHAKLLSADQGNIYMTALGHLEIEELIGTPWIMANGFLFADRMTIDRGAISSNEQLTINDLSMTTSGPLALFAPEIDVTIDGGGAEDTTLAAGGFSRTLTLNTNARQIYASLEQSGFVPESQAQNVAIDLYNAGRMQLTSLYTEGGELRMTGDLLVESGQVEAGVGRNLQVVTGYQTREELTLDLNNSDGTALDVDGQFMTPAGEFWMSIDGITVTTNTQFTRYRQPLLLAFKSQLAGSDTMTEPESFFRLSAEYQNDINYQSDSTSLNNQPGTDDENQELLTISEDWQENFAANTTNPEVSGIDNTIWLTVEKDEEDS